MFTVLKTIILWTVKAGFDNQLLIRSNLTSVFFLKENNFKRNILKYNMKSEFILNMGLGDPKTNIYKFSFNRTSLITKILYNILVCMDREYASSYTIFCHICSRRGNSVIIQHYLLI